MLEVSLKSISLKQAETRRKILSDISLEFLTKNIYVLLGANGSGKSIFLKSLTGLLNKNDFDVNGEIFFLDQNILRLPNNELNILRQRHFRYVFQDSISSFDPLRKFKYYFKLLKYFNLEKINQTLDRLLLPDYNFISNRYPYEVSVGQAQRISLALAVLAMPNILLLDEPTSAVDSANITLLALLLKEYCKNHDSIIIVVTHDDIFASNISDNIKLLKHGSVENYELKRTAESSKEGKD